jgi:hypothetical protein
LNNIELFEFYQTPQWKDHPDDYLGLALGSLLSDNQQSGDIRTNQRTDLGVFVNYYAIPSAGAFVGDITPQDGAIRSPFDASYADRGNHVFFELRQLQSTPITAQLGIGDGIASNVVEIGKRLSMNLERR